MSKYLFDLTWMPAFPAKEASQEMVIAEVHYSGDYYYDEILAGQIPWC